MNKKLKILAIIGVLLLLIFVIFRYLILPTFIHFRTSSVIEKSSDSLYENLNSNLEEFKSSKTTASKVKKLLLLIKENNNFFKISINGETFTDAVYQKYLKFINDNDYYVIDFEYDSSKYINNLILKTYSE